MRNALLILMTAVIFIFAGCGGVNKEIKQDARNIADAMCKNIEAMNKLKVANPADSVLVDELQMKAKQVQIEMTILYQEFKAKYKEQAKEEKFNKEFAKELRKAMLDCKALSEKEREQFEKEMQ
ncbi:MAG: hypothetical protein WCO93_02920 [bacterium]